MRTININGVRLAAVAMTLAKNKPSEIEHGLFFAGVIATAAAFGGRRFAPPASRTPFVIFVFFVASWCP